MIKNKFPEQGTVLILITIVIIILVGLVGSHLTLGIFQTRSSLKAAQREQCYAILDAAVARSFYELNRQDKGASFPIGSASNPIKFGQGCYYVTSQDLTGGNRLLQAYAAIGSQDSSNPYNSAIFKLNKVVLANATPIILPESDPKGAIEINGDPDKMKKFKIPGVNKGAADADDTDGGMSAKISGFDSSGKGNNLLGIAIDASEPVFNKFIAEILKNSKVDWSGIIDGDPMKTYTGKKDPVVVSIDRVDSSRYDYDFFSSFAEAVADKVQTMIPGADIHEGRTKIDADITWGTKDAPVTVYFDNTLTIEKGANVTGYGTLIVDKNVDIHDATFNWYGTIILTGGTMSDTKPKDAKLRNHKGDMYVEGLIILLGTGKGKARLEIHNDESASDLAKAKGKVVPNPEPDTTIKGAIISFSGKEDKPDKSEIRIKHGDTLIDGLISVSGDKTKVDLKAHKGHHTWKGLDRNSSILIDGAVIMAVPEDPAIKDGKSKADIKIHGYTQITWNSDKFYTAVDLLNNLVKNFLPEEQPVYRYVPGQWAQTVKN